MNALKLVVLTVAFISCQSSGRQNQNIDISQPNVLWVVVEDASPHIGCYGETTIATPNIDALAKEGVIFNQAFVSAPVCSAARSAMMAGMYQYSLGAHNHRSQRTNGKGGVSNAQYHKGFEVSKVVKLLPELFKDQGYYVTNGSEKIKGKLGKTDYNFVFDDNLYHSGDWTKRKPGQPFFAQIQLSGGKNRGAKVENAVNPADVHLPPYYPDDEIIRNDWAQYLNSWIHVDNKLGEIVKHLKDEGVYENTILVFMTDHGISHVRGKQFLYEDGIQVPLIINYPKGKLTGERADLVNHIDIGPTLLDLCDIAIPTVVQGNALFADGYNEQKFIYAGRDRCDETVDIIRAVRSKKYKYIRNFYPYRAHTQPSQYKDGKNIVKQMRKLHKEGSLNDLQGRVFESSRPPEELYDLENDPHETLNLVSNADYESTLIEHRNQLFSHMKEVNDLGLIPEPELEDLGMKYGNKYFILEQAENKGLHDDVLAVIEAGNQKNSTELLKYLRAPRASQRYWAANYLGNLGDKQNIEPLKEGTNDSSESVVIASALAILKLEKDEHAYEILKSQLKSEKPIVRLYASLGFEELMGFGYAQPTELTHLLIDDYEFVKRVAKRIVPENDKIML
ncbi:MAG: sulfatase-like hydrolase/transferase [Cyclobacteriaceae bacterium]